MNPSSPDIAIVTPWLRLGFVLLAAFAALLAGSRLLWIAPKVLRDTTTDVKTGHYVFKDVAKLLSLLAGVAIIIGAAVADHLAGREVGTVGATVLLTYALGTAGLKVYESQANRRTASEEGSPLAQPGTAEPPADPKLMPQGEPHP